MRRQKVDREVEALKVCKDFLGHPLQQRVMAVMAAASDEELTELGIRAGKVLELLVRWGKRAMLGLADGEDLRRWFLSDEVPAPVKAFLEHVVLLVYR